MQPGVLTDEKNFYPTPGHLIERMLRGVTLERGMSVLEPSAGAGHIAEAVRSLLKRNGHGWSSENPDIDCVEIDETLRATLRGKGFRVVHDDFLTYSTRKRYDLIVMNPPFDHGDKHLLKALQMQQDGGHVVCLLNAETLRNGYTNTRKELAKRLDEYRAEVKFIEGAFSDAERKTDVEVALVRVAIPPRELVSDFFTQMEQAHRCEEVELPSGHSDTLMNTDLTSFIQSVVNQYRIEVDAGVTLIREYEAMRPHILENVGETPAFQSPIIELKIKDSKYSGSKHAVNCFCEAVRLKYWKATMSSPKFSNRLTSNVMSDFHGKLNTLRDYEFSVFNVFELFAEMQRAIARGIEDTILKLFDNMSAKHAYIPETGNNAHYYNGWKTNRAHRVNKKVILPFYGKSLCGDRYCGFDIFRVRSTVDDLVKTLDYLDNGVTPDHPRSPSNEVQMALERGVSKNIALRHIEVTFYKKGTMHVKFTNEKLLEKFNLFGGLRKGWLPPSYGRKHYRDMTGEEQAVAREFSGNEARYEQLVEEQHYYLPVRAMGMLGAHSGEDVPLCNVP